MRLLLSFLTRLLFLRSRKCHLFQVIVTGIEDFLPAPSFLHQYLIELVDPLI